MLDTTGRRLEGSRGEPLVRRFDNRLEGSMRTGATALLAAAALALAPSPAAAAFPGKNGKLAFSGDGVTVDYDIFVHDGRRLDDLTPDATDDARPAWSADGRRIAWERYADRGSPEIFVMDADGGNRRQVTSGPGVAQMPAWSPGGERIAYYGSARGQGGDLFGLFVIALDGSGERFYGGDGSIDSEPAWSPDGGVIAVASRARDGSGEGLQLLDPDSGVRSRLTSGDDTSPTWSPDGGRVAFVRFADGEFAIHVVNRDGSGIRRVAAPASDVAVPIAVRWSPDGRSLSFVDPVASPFSLDFIPSLIGECCTSVVGLDGSRRPDILTGAGDNDWQPCRRGCRPPVQVDKSAASPAPRRGRTFRVVPTWGVVAVRTRGTRRFRTVRRTRTVPIGSAVDVTAGAARITLGGAGGRLWLTGLPDEPPTSYFTGPVIRSAAVIRQTRRGPARTTLNLIGGDFGRCRKAGAASQVVRSIYGEASKATFVRTVGRYSSMEPLNTRRELLWMLEDRCDGTRNVDRDLTSWVIRDLARGRRFVMRPRIGGAKRLVRPRGRRR